ncbi:MAG: DUF4097 family beta strand repeat protein [Lachnospiraceae bacterium]|nr:DUF4097 family beta strand repeat protein [Lachnospiraceae bacterium]
MSKAGKLAAVCAAVLVVGLALGAAGYALGGVKGFYKVSEKHSWIGSTPGERVVYAEGEPGFDAVEVTGNASVYLVTEKYFKDQKWLDKNELLSATEADIAGENQVVIIKGEKIPDPQISLEDGVLRIYAKEKKTNISFNFSSVDVTPKILICCPDKEYTDFSVNVDTGDIILGGVSYKKASLETDTGDVIAKEAKGDEQVMKSDTGDVILSGTFGKTQIKVDTGDIKLAGTYNKGADINSDTGDVVLKAKAGIDAFDLDLRTDTGDIVISENGQKTIVLDDESPSFTRKGSGQLFKVDVDTGDILLSFN